MVVFVTEHKYHKPWLHKRSWRLQKFYRIHRKWSKPWGGGGRIFRPRTPLKPSLNESVQCFLTRIETKDGDQLCLFIKSLATKHEYGITK